MSDDYSPIVIGDTGNPLRVTFTDGFDVPYVLAGSTFALSLLNLNTSEENAITGIGTWVIVDATNGIAQYAWNAADVATAGVYAIKVVVTFPGGPVTFKSAKPFEIKSK